MERSPARHLWPNVGAEEGDAARVADLPAVVATRQLFAGLFDAATTPLRDDFAPDWADAAASHSKPALAPLGETTGLVPWLTTQRAEQAARNAGVALEGPASAVVEHVHDKAFAVRVSDEEAFMPRDLRGAVHVFEPAGLRDHPDAFAEGVRDRVAAWPPELKAGGFTIKPRVGTSGRGRVAGDGAAPDLEVLRNAAGRLASRGGAILEPWLRREVDLSVVAWLSRPGHAHDAPPLTLIGALRQWVTRSGGWRGHLGEVDRRGRIYSGTGHDDAMREAAAVVANAAHAEGHFGPCGVDGFTFGLPVRDAAHRLRPIVEFNARFTMGHICAGWVRRALPWLVAERGLEPGRRVAFLFALEPPGPDRDWRALARASGADVLTLPFSTNDDAPKLRPIAPEPGGTVITGPALCFHTDAGALEAWTA